MFSYQYILNPITKRKVSVHTITGKQIINNFIKVAQSGGSTRLETLKQRASLRDLAPNPNPTHPQSKPKGLPKPIPKTLFREVTTISKGTTQRLSAGEYIRYGGKEGDICDIRNDGELRCLIIGKTGTPSWKNITQNTKTLTYKTCGSGPWKPNCKGSSKKMGGVSKGKGKGHGKGPDLGKVHEVPYLTNLLMHDDFKNDISKKIYKRAYKVTDFIPFKEITTVIPIDMEHLHGDKTFGLSGVMDERDSANWYKDHLKFNINDVILDRTGGYSRSDLDAWLVVEKKKKLGLLMFPMSDGSEPGFGDGDTINSSGQMIHPLTKKLVNIEL